MRESCERKRDMEKTREQDESCEKKERDETFKRGEKSEEVKNERQWREVKNEKCKSLTVVIFMRTECFWNL